MAEKNNAPYHVSKRKTDNKWEVYRAGSTKAIKLFATKAEAEAYVKQLSENQGVGFMSHASKGANKGKVNKSARKK